MKSTIALVAGSASIAFAATTSVVNRCSFDLYLWSAGGNGTISSMFTIPSGTGYKEEQWLPMRDGKPFGAVSIKMAPFHINGGVPSRITQFEYNPLPGNLWYDISFVDGNALNNMSTTLYPSKDCPVVKSTITHQEGYHVWNDDSNTHSCGSETDLLYTICADGTDGAGLRYPTGNTNEAALSKIPKRDAEPIALCADASGAVTYCEESEPAPAPAVVPASAPAKAPAPAPIVALQAEATTTSTPPAAAATPVTPPPAAQPQTNGLDAPRLRLVVNSGVSSWTYGPGQLQGPGQNARREAEAEAPAQVEEAPVRRRRHVHSHGNKLSHSH